MCTTVPNLEEILPRGQVLLKKEKMGKLTTAFSPVPYTVVSKKGNSTIIVTTTSALHAQHKSCEEAPDINNRPCLNNGEEMDKETNKPKSKHTNEGAAPPTYSQVESPQRIKTHMD